MRGFAARSPLIGGAFGAAVLALLGFPPFSLFASELAVFRAGFAAGLGWAVAAALALLLVATAAIAAGTARMLLGGPGPGTATFPSRPRPGRRPGSCSGCSRAPRSESPLALHDLLLHAAAVLGAH